MKLPFIFLAAALSGSASAQPIAKNFALTCSTSVASLSLAVEGAKLHFHLSDAAGAADFPIYSGVVTPAMLPIVERGAKDLAAFDRDVDIAWDAAKCKVDPKHPLLVSCDGRGEITEPAQTTVVATSLGTSTSVVQSIDVNAEIVNVNLGLSTTGNDFAHYFVSFPFNRQHCSVGSRSVKNL